MELLAQNTLDATQLHVRFSRTERLRWSANFKQMDSEKRQTVREAYRLLDKLTSGGDPVQTDRRHRLMDVPYLGRPLGDHDAVYDAKEFSETLSFAHLAVALNLDGEIANIENRKPKEPDLYVAFKDGTAVYVEIAQITASEAARADGAMRTIRTILNKRYDSDPALAAALQGRFVEFKFRVDRVLTRREARLAAEEIIAVFQSIDFMTVERKTFLDPLPSIAPTLAKAGARYWVGVGTATALGASLGAHSFDPSEAADDLDARVADKLTKTYETHGLSVWLCLALTDMQQVPTLSMEAIRSRLPANFGQFSRLLIGTMEDAEMIVRS